MLFATMKTHFDFRPATTETIYRQVLQIEQIEEQSVCVLKEGGRVLVSNFLAAQIRPGDEVELPLVLDSPDARPELYVHKKSTSARKRDVYQVSISYAAHPKSDRREQLFVRAEVSEGHMGMSALHIPCDLIRDYFYVAKRGEAWDRQVSLYEMLRIPSSASLAELRLAFKLRELELRIDQSPMSGLSALERAFNILADPQLRTCYDRLLQDSSAPAIFPHGGFGSIIAAGHRSRDGPTFFVTRILYFVPERRRLRFRAPLRKVDFYADRAVYRDTRRKLEVVLDQSAMPIVWDATWNQWKHLLGTKADIEGTFVTTGKYSHRRGEWDLEMSETALPSRLQVKLPETIAQEIDAARQTYHRFGQFSDALEHLRVRIEREPVEKTELQRLCWNLGLPGDFDVAQITWKPDYDAFYYRQLCQRARRIRKDRCGRNSPTGPRDLSILEGRKHGGISGCLHQNGEGRYPQESRQHRRNVGIPGPGCARR
jgi:hypothetical protein